MQHSFSVLGAFTVLFTLFALLTPWNLSQYRLALSLIVATVSATYGLYRVWPKPIIQSFDRPNIVVCVAPGDLFSEPGDLLIGMATTFDTSTPVIIAPSSIQGQFLEKIFRNNVAELDACLNSALETIAPSAVLQKAGKTDVYPLGTVATIDDHGRNYYCLAYTEMNEHNNARATIAGIWHSLDCLWLEVSRKGNGRIVSAPVVGGGQSRLAQQLPTQDSIRLMILSYIFASRREKVSGGLKIVVTKEAFKNLDRLELQAFLSSLRRS